MGWDEAGIVNGERAGAAEKLSVDENDSYNVCAQNAKNAIDIVLARMVSNSV